MAHQYLLWFHGRAPMLSECRLSQYKLNLSHNNRQSLCRRPLAVPPPTVPTAVLRTPQEQLHLGCFTIPAWWITVDIRYGCIGSASSLQASQSLLPSAPALPAAVNAA
jgi:hypothetical protein